MRATSAVVYIIINIEAYLFKSVGDWTPVFSPAQLLNLRTQKLDLCDELPNSL